ncbi:MAG: aldo/keto reductase [Desulfobacterales bacterium]|nr:MAG: aldo/keto reductase [Desulfobacterales bacterium]
MAQTRISRRRFLKNLTVTCTYSGLFVHPIAARYAEGTTDKNVASIGKADMEYRLLGRTGLKVSALSFGVMRLTEPAVLFEALDMGINYFDTAHVYQRGNNEKMLGNVLKEYGRKKVFIATKIPPYSRFLNMSKLDSPSTMEAKMEKSLKRLQTDYVDVLFLHNIKDPAWPAQDDMLRFCQKMKEAGKARYVGISFHSDGELYVNTVNQALKTDAYDVILATLNYKSYHEEIAALRRARSKNVGVIAMKTQAGGYKRGPSAHINPHQAALRWALDLDFVDCAIPGMVNRRQLVENAKVIGMKMGWSDRKTLAVYYDTIKDRYCLRCGTCKSSCIKTVEIPSVHRSLMYWEGYEDFGLGQTTYRRLSTKENALACLSCSTPTCICKYGIQIPERMRHAHTIFV